MCLTAFTRKSWHLPRPHLRRDRRNLNTCIGGS
nr:MAG TPA: hypothetical protein [Caudoviricetes sp.]